MSVAFQQTSLAAAIAVSSIGSYLGVTPPNKETAKTAPKTGDIVQNRLIWAIVPISASLPLILGMYSAYVAYHYPDLSHVHRLVGSGVSKELNPKFFTWSPYTILPLILLLTIGIPLRLSAYRFLGKNFTFKLKEPSGLITTGLYRYVQHPSYTGLAALFIGNIILIGQPDGVLSLVFPNEWYGPKFWLGWRTMEALALLVHVLLIWIRVTQEENMLKNEFGAKWVEWNKRTARFIPGVL